MSDPGQHSILPPSSAARNIQCPASTLHEARFPEMGDDTASREGTAAHHAMEVRFTPGAPSLVPDESAAPNGVIIDKEMIETAELLYDDVKATIGEPWLPAVRVEMPVAIPRTHAQCWGTPDVHVYIPDYALYVWDLKYGHGIVEVFENPQLIDYGSGLGTHYGMPESTPVVFRIVQPRAYHKDGVIREWRTTLLALRALINIRSNAAHEALAPNPRFMVGPECDHCRGRHACDALQRAAGNAADISMRGHPLEMSLTAIGTESLYLRRAMTLLKARISGLDEQMLAAIRKGQRVPHFTIERSNGRTVWAVPPKDAIAVARAMEVDISKPAEAMTPKQAIEAGLPADVVAGLSKSLPGEAKLVVDDGSTERRIFGR
jgi:hypothetical protein